MIPTSIPKVDRNEVFLENNKFDLVINHSIVSVFGEFFQRKESSISNGHIKEYSKSWYDYDRSQGMSYIVWLSIFRNSKECSKLKKTFSAVDVHFSGSKECYLTWFVNCKLNYCQFPMHISAWNWRINGGYGVYMNLLAAMRYGAAVHHQKP